MIVRTLAVLAICALAGCSGGGGTQPGPADHSQIAPNHGPQCRGQCAPISNVVAFMGDSITFHWDLSQYDAGSTINFGYGGDTTVGMLARFPQVIAAAPGVVVILGGVNDFVEFGVAGTNIDSIKAMAAQAQAAGIRVILCSVTPIQPMAWATNGDIEAFNQQLIDLARANGYLYADYYDEMLDATGAQNAALFVDYVHPSPAGYAVMWKVISPLLQEDGL